MIRERLAKDRYHYAGPSDGEKVFVLNARGRTLRASGIREWISTPALGGENASSAFQQSISAALSRARKSGQGRPVVVGAVPFDVREPSCLYVPETCEWHEDIKTAETRPADFAAPRPVGQNSIPDEAGFKRSVEQAIASFRSGDVRKVVLSVMCELRFSGAINVESLLARLRAQNEKGYQFRVPLPDGAELIGVSPELLVRRQGISVISNPLAGSARRRPDTRADEMAAQDLMKSSKDQHEHRFVAEHIRRLLAPLCARLDAPASPSLMSTAALWHLSTVIEGRLKDPSTTALQLACLLHPTPAVCGFPTQSAHRLIRLVEPFKRGLFTGFVGWCDSEGNGEWVVTIRCGIIKNDTVRLFAGAGIVETSQPESEWSETQTKLGTMLAAFGLAA